MNDKSHLSKEETLKRVSLYSKLGNERQFFDIEKLQESYKLRQQKIEQDRIQRDHYYAQGLNKGLPHTDYKTLLRQRALEDQKSRTVLLAESKERYRRGHNLSKWLNKEVGNTNTKSNPSKAKNKNMHKRLGKYFNKPVAITKQFNKHKTIEKERER